MGRMASARVGLVLSMLAFGLVPTAGCGSSESDNDDSNAEGGKADPGTGGTSSEGGTPGTGGDFSEGGNDFGQGGTVGTGGEPSSGGRGGRASGGGGRQGTGGNLGFGGFDNFGGANHGGSSVGGSFGGSAGVAGFPGGRGGFANSGGSFGSGGASGCLEGVPCKCNRLVGTTKCDGATQTCECPPASECALEPSSCFEPCGGEPFGTWVLEDSCFGAGEVGAGCSGGLVTGKAGPMDLRLRILDGGALEVFGQEVWDIHASVPLSCVGLQSVNSCPNAFFFRRQPLLFSSSHSMTCTANACGVCDCVADVSTQIASYGSWARGKDDEWLQLDGNSVPYCAKGDTLWLGGSGSSGEGMVAYKFSKQSCTGKPVACSKRPPEACIDDCFPGGCVRTTGTAPGCERATSASDCGVLQGCTWDPDLCSGTAYDVCNFENCGTVPGCTWGPPVARCAGEALPCEQRDLSQCNTDGCAEADCFSVNSQDAVSCTTLSVADCPKAAGCTVVGGNCTGTTQCSTQTDINVCSSLSGCFFEPHCAGPTPPACSTHTVETCQGTYGCRIEW